MPLYAYTSISVSIFCFIFGVFIYRNSKTTVHRLWSLFNIGVANWSFGVFLAVSSNNLHMANFGWKWAYGFGVFVPAVFYHFAHSYCGFKKRRMLVMVYVLAIILFLMAWFSKTFIVSNRFLFGSIFYNDATLQYTILISYVSLLALFSLFEFYRFCRSDKGRQLEGGFILFSFGLGWSGGFITFLPAYGLNVYPIWNIVICLNPVILTYAIFEHKFFDIKVVIRRSVVYSILVAIITLLYLVLVVGFEGALKKSFHYDSNLISGMFVFSLGVLFMPLRQSIQNFVDRKMFKGTQFEIAEQNEKLRSEIVQSEKYKTMATLSSGIAHEIKNPLQAIQTFCEFLPIKKQDGAFLDKFADLVGKEVGRIDRLVRHLMDYSRPQQMNIKENDLTALLNDSIDILTSKFMDKKIIIRREYLTRAPCEVRVDKNYFKQVLFNLLLNAIDALETGGRLSVDVDKICLDKDYVRVIITDNGHGMTKEEQARIFDPFYSNKDGGTGLGLAICQKVIDQHGGNISVQSEKGQGTAFFIDLPLG